ncbi:MAG: cache domain-containing protein, partial [Candidatus Tantalella remota]|nr:cache domain-containing protein [Candidatus Tantalella remota]
MKIASKISRSFFLTAAILAVTGISIFYTFSQKAIEKSVMSHLEIAADSRADQVNTFFDNKKSLMLLVAQTEIIRKTLELDVIAGLSPEVMEKVNSQLSDFMASNEDICEVFLMESSGRIVASSDEEHVGFDKCTDAYFLGARTGPYVKDAYFSDTKKRPSMAVSAPVFSGGTGEFLGVVCVRIKLKYLEEIALDRTGMGDTGEVYIVNKYGYMITPLRWIKDTFLKQKISSGESTMILRDDEKGGGNEGVIDLYIDYRGSPVIGACSYVAPMEWKIIAKQDVKEALRSIEGLKMLGALIILVVPLLAWLIGLVVSKAITDPVKRLVKGAERIGKGDFNHKVGIRAKDEIGDLSRVFDMMTESLKTTTTSVKALNKEVERSEAAEGEAKHSAQEWQETFDSITDLISIQDKDFRILRVNKAYAEAFGMKPEEIEGKLCHELVHGTKDPWPTCPAKELFVTKKAQRSEFFEPKLGIYLEVLTTPILDEEGEVAGIVHITKDISERKKSEKRINELARFPGENPNPIMRVSKEGEILYSNSGGKKILDEWGTVVGGKVPENWKRVLEKAFEDNSPIVEECDITGQVYAFTVTTVKDAGYANLYGRDITEQKKSDQRIKESEEKFKSLYENSTDALMMLTSQKGFISGNPAA